MSISRIFIIVLLAVVAALSAAQEAYNLRFLGLLHPTGESATYGVNDAFQAVGVATNAVGVDQAFVWDVQKSSAGLVELPRDAGIPGARAWRINNAGLVVGEQLVDSATSRATVWTPIDPGDITRGHEVLAFEPGTHSSTARGIDDFGNIVGWRWTSGSPNTEAAFFRSQAGTYSPLPLGAATRSRAYSVATSSTGVTYVAGAVFQGRWIPARWVRASGGTSFTLEIPTMPGGFAGDGFSYGVNRLGNLAGEITLDFLQRGFVWTSGVARLLQPLTPGFACVARDINDGKRVVGEAAVVGGGTQAIYANDQGGNPQAILVTTNPSAFGYRSGAVRQAFDVCDVSANRHLNGDYIPSIAMRGQTSGGTSHAVLARPKVDRDNRGMAIGGVAVVIRADENEVNAGTPFMLQLRTNYRPPALGTEPPDYQAEPIPGILEFRLTANNSPTTLGGSSLFEIVIPPGESQWPPDEGSDNVTAQRGDAGKQIRVNAIIEQAYVEASLAVPITIRPLVPEVLTPGGVLRVGLGQPLALPITVRDTIFLQGLSGAEVFCQLFNPVTGARFYFDCTESTGKLTNASGGVTFNGLVPASIGISQPSNPVVARFTVKSKTTGTVFPHYTSGDGAEKPLDIFSDTVVSVPDMVAAAGETLPVTAVLSGAQGIPIAGQRLDFYRVGGSGLEFIGWSNTTINGYAAILVTTPAPPFIGNVTIVVQFDGQGNYQPSEGTGRIRIGSKSLMLENYIIGASAAVPYDNVPIGTSGQWTLQGTFGEPIVGVPDSQELSNLRVSNAFWRTVGPLIKRLRWF